MLLTIEQIRKATNPIPKIITENPFRILGVYANSPKKDIISNQSKATKFLKVGREVDFPLDLKGILPPLTRTVDMFTKASGNLAVAKEQFKYAQFWFLKSTPLDDVAFNHLVTGDMSKAVEIWEKKDSPSSLHNRMLCHFILGDYELAINAAEYLYAKFADDFLTIADTTGTLRLDSDNMVHQFIDILSQDVDSVKIMNYACSQEWKEYAGGKTVKPLIEKINAEIQTAKEADDDDADESLEAGEQLLKNTKLDFAQLKKILPSDDAQLENIADKLGLQILQCGINYYNNSDDDDAAEKAMVLQKAGSQIVMGKIAQDRCKDNLNVLKKIIADLPPKEVRKEYKAVMDEVSKTIQKKELISNANSLLKATKSNIQTIKQKLGSTHKEYIKVSTLVVQIAMSFVVEEVNKVQAAAMLASRIDSINRYQVRDMIKNKLSDAWSAILLMDDFDIDYEFKSHYNENRNALKSMCEDFGVPRTNTITTSPKPPITSPPQKNEPVYPTPKNNEDINVGKIILWLIIIVIFICIISKC